MTLAATIHCDFDRSPTRCSVAEISARHARVLVANADDIPAEFTLLIGGNGAVRRRCTVLEWRPGELRLLIDR
jgi:hypothetical protein